MKPPIYNGLMKYIANQKTLFNSPGHKGKVRMKSDNLGRIDISFSPVTDCTPEPESFILKSEEEIAGIFGASKSYYLTGGTDAGIYTMLASVCTAGDKIIVDSECNKAVIHAITLLSLYPVFIKRSYCAKYSFNGGINTEELDYTAEKHRDAKAILITTPTYYGVCANIRKASEIAKRNNMFLLVDETLGTHFNFSEESPESAVSCGADMVVHSASKTLGSFSGSGLLHLISNDINPQTVRDFLDIYQGSSHSTSMLCAIENAIYYAFENTKKYNALFREIEHGKQLINANTDLLWFDNEYNNGCDIDEIDHTRIVLNFSAVSISGISAAKILSGKYGIEPESADNDNVVFSVSLYNTPSEIRRLVNACYTIAKLVSPVDEIQTEDESGIHTTRTKINVKVPPCKAFICESELVDFRESAGRICKKMVYKIPQETPILIPGEKITLSHIEKINKILNNEGMLNGLNSNLELEVLNLSDSFYF